MTSPSPPPGSTYVLVSPTIRTVLPATSPLLYHSYARVTDEYEQQSVAISVLASAS